MHHGCELGRLRSDPRFLVLLQHVQVQSCVETVFSSAEIEIQPPATFFTRKNGEFVNVRPPDAEFASRILLALCLEIAL